MTMRTIGSAVLVMVLLLAMGAGRRVHAQSTPAVGGALHVAVVGVHSDQGRVGCALYTSADGYPTDSSKAVQRLFVPIKDGGASCDFSGLAAGRYAVAVFHDVDSSGKLKKSFLGIPTEETGASNDARGAMGPPKFADAVFDFDGGQGEMTIHAH
jgi:uncharacterized protein (DUF2141 family)